MMEALRFSETWLLARTTRFNIPEDGILQLNPRFTLEALFKDGILQLNPRFSLEALLNHRLTWVKLLWFLQWLHNNARSLPYNWWRLSAAIRFPTRSNTLLSSSVFKWNDQQETPSSGVKWLVVKLNTRLHSVSRFRMLGVVYNQAQEQDELAAFFQILNSSSLVYCLSMSLGAI
jgi:hypothetical protein